MSLTHAHRESQQFSGTFQVQESGEIGASLLVSTTLDASDIAVTVTEYIIA